MTQYSELPPHGQGQHNNEWQSQVRQQLEEELEQRVRDALQTPPVERLRRRLSEQATSCCNIVDYDQLNAHLDLAAKAREYKQRRQQRARNLLGSFTDRNATSCLDLASGDGRNDSGEPHLGAAGSMPRDLADGQNSSADLDSSAQQLNVDAADCLRDGAGNASERSSETNLWSAVVQPLLPAPTFIDTLPEMAEPLWLDREGPDTFEAQRTPYGNQKWRGGATVVFDSLRSPKDQEQTTGGGGSSSALVAPSLVFESRFESGNLQLARRIGQFEYELLLKTDLYTKRHTQWYYFRVQNAIPGVIYKFRITNFLKKDSLYNYGMKPLFYSEADAKKRNFGWMRKGHHIRYSVNTQHLNTSLHSRDMVYYELEWQIEFDNANDTCYLAHCYPYTFSDLKRDLDTLMADPQRSAVSRREVLCETKAGNSCFLVTVTNFESKAPKKCIVVSARVHPGESNASWMMKGLLEYITSAEAIAVELRKAFIFKIVPMLNPDGVIIGNYRCDLTGKDLNRNYRWPEKHSFPTVAYLKSMVEHLQNGSEVLVYCDLHGHSKKSNVFMYGCNSPESIAGDTNAYIAERLFPFLISRQAPDMFSFPSCKFKIQRKKESTGRVVMYRQMKIKNSFTLEATFSGTLLDRRGSRHFNQKDYQEIGRIFCAGLHDYMLVLQNKGKETEAVVDLTRTLMQRLLKLKASEEPVGTSQLPPALPDIRIESSPKGRLANYGPTLLRSNIRSSSSSRKSCATSDRQRQVLPMAEPLLESLLSSAKHASEPCGEPFTSDPVDNRGKGNIINETEKSVLHANIPENVLNPLVAPGRFSNTQVVTIEACTHLLHELMIGTTGAVSDVESDSSSDSDSESEAELRQAKVRPRKKKKAAKASKKKMAAETGDKQGAAKPAASKISRSMVELSDVGRRQTAPSRKRKPAPWHRHTSCADVAAASDGSHSPVTRSSAGKPVRAVSWSSMLPSINKHLNSASTDVVQQLGSSAKGRPTSEKDALLVNDSDGVCTKLPVKRPPLAKAYHWVNPYVGRTNGGIPCFSERRSLQRAARRMSDALRLSCKELWEAACRSDATAGAGGSNGEGGDGVQPGIDGTVRELASAVGREAVLSGFEERPEVRSEATRPGAIPAAATAPAIADRAACGYHSAGFKRQAAQQHDSPLAASSCEVGAAAATTPESDDGSGSEALTRHYATACGSPSSDELASAHVHSRGIACGPLSDGLRAQLLLPALVPRRPWPSEMHSQGSRLFFLEQPVESQPPHCSCRFHSTTTPCMHHDCCCSVEQPTVPSATSYAITRDVGQVLCGDGTYRPEKLEASARVAAPGSPRPPQPEAVAAALGRASTVECGNLANARCQTAAVASSLDPLVPSVRSRLLALPSDLCAADLRSVSHRYAETAALGRRVAGQQQNVVLPVVSSHGSSYLTELLRVHSMGVPSPERSSYSK